LQDLFPNVAMLKEETGIDLPSYTNLNLSSFMENEQGKRLTSLFCRDVVMDYLTLLVNRFPEDLPCYVLLDPTSLSNPLDQALFLHPERYDRIHVAVKGNLFHFPSLAWNCFSSYGYLASQPIIVAPQPLIHIGICLPPVEMHRPSQYQGLEEALRKLLIAKIPFRLIPERNLVTEWDGLDYLLYIPSSLSSQGKRKLQGFCAAAGTAVSLGQAIGLPQEISFAEFIQINHSVLQQPIF
jgi:hypothetical protein